MKIIKDKIRLRGQGKVKEGKTTVTMEGGSANSCKRTMVCHFWTGKILVTSSSTVSVCLHLLPLTYVVRFFSAKLVLTVPSFQILEVDKGCCCYVCLCARSIRPPNLIVGFRLYRSQTPVPTTVPRSTSQELCGSHLRHYLRSERKSLTQQELPNVAVQGKSNSLSKEELPPVANGHSKSLKEQEPPLIANGQTATSAGA